MKGILNWIVVLLLTSLLLGCGEETSTSTFKDLDSAVLAWDRHHESLTTLDSKLDAEEILYTYVEWHNIGYALAIFGYQWEAGGPRIDAHFTTVEKYLDSYKEIYGADAQYEELLSYYETEKLRLPALTDPSAKSVLTARDSDTSFRMPPMLRVGGVDCGSYDHGCDNGGGGDSCEDDPSQSKCQEDSCSGKKYQGRCVSTVEYYFLVVKDGIDNAATTIGGALINTVSTLATAASTVVESTLTATIEAIKGVGASVANLLGFNTETNCNGGVTESPVEPSTGCKLWMSADVDQLSSPFFSVNRNYKQFHSNDFSLGTYWAFSFDSRIIWGLDDVGLLQAEKSKLEVLAQKQADIIQAVDDSVQELESGFDMSNSMIEDYINNITGEKEGSIGWIQQYRETAVLEKAEFERMAGNVQEIINQNNLRNQNNVYSAAHADPESLSVGQIRMKWIAPSGAQHSFIEQNNGNTFAAEGHLNTLEKYEDGFLATDSAGTEYFYNQWGLLTRIVDVNKNELAVARDVEDPLKITEVVDQNGRKLVFGYGVGNDHRLDTITDEVGRSLTYEYKNYGSHRLLHKVIGFDGLVTTFEYEHYSKTYSAVVLDAQQQITVDEWLVSSRQRGEGKRTIAYVWSELLKKFVVDEQVGELGKTWTYQYEQNQTTVVNRDQATFTRYIYDDERNLKRQEFGSNLTGEVDVQQFGYNADGLRDKAWDEEGYLTTYGFNDRGQPILEQRGELGSTISSYADNHLEDVTNGAGEVTDYVYENDLLTSIHKPGDGNIDGTEVELRYYPETNLVHKKLEHTSDGAFTETYTYDDNGFVESITKTTPFYEVDPAVITIVNDSIGRQKSVTDTAGRTTRYYYREDERENPNNAPADRPQSVRSYDNPVRIEMPVVVRTLPNGAEIHEDRAIRFWYDTYNRLVKKADHTGVVTEYTYYANDDIETKTETIPHPEGDIIRSWAYTYTPERKLETVHETQHQDDIGRFTRYQYDFRDRLERKVVMKAPFFTAETDIQESFTYFDNGWLKSRTDAEGNTWHYTYTDAGLLKTETNPDQGITTYDYDQAGRRTGITETVRHADGSQTDHYTSLSPTTINKPGERITADNNRLQFEYFQTGALKSRSVDNQHGSTWTHRVVNHLGQPVITELPSGDTVERRYNGVGQLTRELNAEGDETIKRYDALGRLVFQQDPNGLETTWDYEQLADQLLITRVQTDTQLPVATTGRQRVERSYKDFLGRLIRTELDVSATQLQPTRTLVWSYDYDTQGLLERITYPETDPDTGELLTTEYDYDDYGRLVSQTDPGNRVTHYLELDALGRPQQVQAPDQRLRSYDYNFRGQPLTVTLPDQMNQERFDYNSRGERERHVNPEGLTQRWHYTGEGRLARSHNQGNALQQIPALNPWVYDYDALGNRTVTLNPEGERTERTFDANGQPAGVYDAAYTFFDIDSDTLGRPVTERDAYGVATTRTYEDGGRKQIIEAPNGTTQLDFNAFGELIRIEDAEGNIVRYTYDERGQRIAQWDRLNNPSYFAYNTRGQITRLLDEAQRETRYDYNAAGNLTGLDQPAVGRTHYQYDAGNRVTAITSAKGASAWDEAYTRHYDYDANGYLDTVTNELDRVTDYDFDASGWVEAINQPNYDRIEFGYNALGQRTQRTANGDARTTEQWNYDDLGRLTGIHNSDYQESYQYDTVGNLDIVTNTTLNQSIDYGYDLNRRRTAMASDGQNVIYQRDDSGRVTQLTTEDDSFTFGYDNNDRLVSQTASNGTRDLRLYNERGEIIAIALQRQQQPDESPSYGFDDRFLTGYQRDANVPASASLYAFERHLSNVAQQLQAEFPQNGYVTEDLLVYQYSPAGNLIAKQYNEKFSFFYEYDAADRLTAAYEPENLVTRYDWDNNGNLVEKRVRNLVFDYQYNSANQLTQGTEWRLEHTGNGNSKGNANNGPHKANGTQEDWDQHHHDQFHYFEYLWDTKVNLNREAMVTTYSYDRNGERASKTTQADTGSEIETYAHDVYGRLTGIGTHQGAEVSFKYDSRDRRIASAQRGWTTQINKADNKTAADYRYTSLYDGRQELHQFDEQGNPYRSLTYLPNQQAGLYGQLLSQTLHQWQNPEFDATGWGTDLAPKLYFHGDYQGSTIKVTARNPETTFRYGYTPTGEAYAFKHRYSNEQMTRTHVSHSLNRNVVPYLYTSRYMEPLTGLSQMDARWYEAETARFIQPDQYNMANLMLPPGAQSELLRYIGRSQSDLLRDPAQQMRYGYVSGNPLRWVDPLGLDFKAEPWDHLVYGANVNTQGSNSSFLSSLESMTSRYSPESDPFVQVVNSDEGKQVINDFTSTGIEVGTEPAFVAGAGTTTVGTLTANPTVIFAGLYTMSTSATKTLTEYSIVQHGVRLFTSDPMIVETSGFVEDIYGGGSGLLKSIDTTVNIIDAGRKIDNLQDGINYFSNAEGVYSAIQSTIDQTNLGYTTVSNQSGLMCRANE